MEYKEKIVVFLDILGFKNAVDKSIADPTYVDKIYKIVHRIFDGKKQNDNGPLEMKSHDLQISTFSDSLVISYPTTKSDALPFVIMHIIWTMFDLLYSGFVARGGISVGQLYHDGDVIFGPAMNEAYYLESNCAIYPRIIISKATIDHCLAISKKIDQANDIESWLHKILSIDKDGFYFVDFLSQSDEFDYDDIYMEWLWKVKEVIENGLKGSKKSEKLFAKYVWLADYYNTTLKQFNTIPECCPTSINIPLSF